MKDSEKVALNGNEMSDKQPATERVVKETHKDKEVMAGKEGKYKDKGLEKKQSWSSRA